MNDKTNRSPHIEALKSSKEYNRILFEQSPIGLALCLRDGTLIDVNPAYAKIIGRSVNETLGLSYWDITPERYAETENRQLEELEQTGKYGPYEKHYIHKDGHLVPVRLSGQILNLGDEEFIWSCVEDISERTNAEQALIHFEKNLESDIAKRTADLAEEIRKKEQIEQALRVSEARHRAILDGAVDGIITIDETGLIDSFNPAAEHMFGYSARQVIGKNVNILMPEPYQSSHDQYIENYIDSSQAKIIGKGREVKGRRKDGTVFDMYLAVSDIAIAGRRLFTGIISDITDLKQTQIALKVSDERFRRSQRFANIGTWDWNIETGELYWSEKIATLFGYNEGELETTYENFLNALHPDDRQNVIDAVNACVEHGKDYNIEHRCIWPNGEIRWILEKGDVIRDSSGKPLRMLGVVQDITARKQAEVDLQTAKDDAERANRAKSEFLSHMSHELRTPLNAILGFAQLLEYDKQLNTSQKESVLEIHKAGNHLLELISEVLDLAKIESGHVALSIEPVSLSKMLDECCNLTKTIAVSKNISLTCNPTGEQKNEKYVLADNIRLKQVLLNLLSNAVKYNRDNGSISVSCTTTAENTIILKVNDTGIGISEEKIAQLFQPFNRLGAEGSEIEGTGIGLVITRKLVAMMGGNMGVESAKNEGSCFWVELPRFDKPSSTKVSAPEKATVLAISSNKKHGKYGKILVLEDNLTNQVIIRNQLKVLGYKSDIASNGNEGFELWRNNRYVSVLTDINMPDMDGFDFTKLIRKSERNSDLHTPIIAVTAKALQGDDELCLLAGMDDYISKPVDLIKLGAILDKWVRPVSNEKVIANKPVTTADNKDPIDLNILQDILGENSSTHKEVLDNFTRSANDIVNDIKTAYTNHSAPDIIWASHKLKSSSLSIGAKALASSCEALETAAKENSWEDIALIYHQLDGIFTEVIGYIRSYKQYPIDSIPPSVHVKTQLDFSSLNILVVDDDRFMLGQIVEIIKRLHIPKPATATSGKQALHILDKNIASINIIICDLNMPGMDGIELLRHIAERKYQGAVILASGEDNKVLKSAEKLAKAHRLNVLGVLQKPITAEQLESLVRKFKVAKDSLPAKPSILVAKKDLHQGINKNQLTVFYQPKIEISTGNLVGVEALARWNHPERGILGPNTFIPVAEKHGLIDALTVTVFSQAVEQGKQWQDNGLTLKIAINLSTDSLKRLELPELFISQIDDSGLDYSQITFEVTESRLISDITTSMEICTRLKLKGIDLSIDDFGTGYSTMEQLQRIPFTELKVDRKFVTGASNDASSRAILESSVELAKKLNMKVVAEGVETEQDLELVTKIGCDYIQGFYIARPMPADDFLLWLDNWKLSNQFQKLTKKTAS